MATVSRNSNSKNQQQNNRGYALYIWLFLLTATLITGGYAGLLSYREYVDPVRVYGEWSEIGAPDWSTERFSLSPEGVMSQSRFVSSSFEFDGSIVSFKSGGELIEYQVFGGEDERLKRVTGGGHVASFIKHGYEHTLPKQDNIGPARRVSLAEHFQSKQ